MKRIYQLSLLITLSACTSSKITTTNLHDLTAYEPNSHIYALPQTRIVVSVDAVKSTFIPGPYQKYAKEFLGIDIINSEKSTSWYLVNFKLFTLTEPDPEQYYSVASTGNINVQDIISKMTQNGILLGVNSNSNNYQIAFNNEIKAVEELPFTDLSSKPFYFNETRKKQKNMLEDSAFAIIPGLEKQFIAKSEKEKAFEAAQFIFKIRKRRFKLVSGKYDISPDSSAIAISVNELNKLEANYLSLFIGKNNTDTITQLYSVTPDAGQSLQRFTMFRFSDASGFYTSSESEGEPVIMEIEDLNKNEILNQLQIPRSNSIYENMLFYRESDKALVTIFNGSHIALESEISVFQIGSVVPYFVSTNK